MLYIQFCMFMFNTPSIECVVHKDAVLTNEDIVGFEQGKSMSFVGPVAESNNLVKARIHRALCFKRIHSYSFKVRFNKFLMVISVSRFALLCLFKSKNR